MAEQPSSPRGLFRLIGDVPALIVQLFRDELESFKNELTKKISGIAIGVGLLVAAGAVALMALVMLVIAAVFALALVVPEWAAALIVAGVLLLIVLVLVLIGLAQFKRGDLGKPVRSVQEDVKTIKGIGRRS